MEKCQALELAVLEAQVMKAQAEAQFHQTLNLPHRTYLPALTHDGMQYIAKWGMDEQKHPLCVGFGDTPSEALMNFSLKWLGVTPE